MKIFKKASYIGRKILGSQQDAQPPLKAILSWYKSIIEHFKSHMDLLKATCGPLLELVHRTFTDQTLTTTDVNTLSTEIIETLSTAFESKEFFI